MQNYIFPAKSKGVSDNKGHFPIPDVAHGRNALAQVAKYDALPTWYKGSMNLAEFKEYVQKKVKKAFPSIDVTVDKVKDGADDLHAKFKAFRAMRKEKVNDAVSASSFENDPRFERKGSKWALIPSEVERLGIVALAVDPETKVYHVDYDDKHADMGDYDDEKQFLAQIEGQVYNRSLAYYKEAQAALKRNVQETKKAFLDAQNALSRFLKARKMPGGVKK